jgi:hypothetical protein
LSRFLLIFVFSILVNPLYGKVIIIKNKKKTIKNSHCTHTKSCSLKNISIESYDYKVSFNKEVNYGTSMRASYKTKSPTQLEDYAFINYIKGCHFVSSVKQGILTKKVIRKRRFFNEYIKYSHPEWIIDSNDTDPMYYTDSNSGKLRHYYYFWESNKNMQHVSKKYFGEIKPSKPELFISDSPGTAFYDKKNGIANNISLKFKTCIFKTKSIPRFTKAHSIKHQDALYCLDWSSSFVYNHSLKNFEFKNTLDSFCLNTDYVALNSQ